MEWTGSQNRSKPAPRTAPVGIASMNQAKDVFRDNFGVRMVVATPWGSAHGQPLSEFHRIVHARRIAAEMERLQARWPQLRGKVKGFSNNQPKAPSAGPMSEAAILTLFHRPVTASR